MNVLLLLFGDASLADFATLFGAEPPVLLAMLAGCSLAALGLMIATSKSKNRKK